MIGLSQPVVAIEGDDDILPCHIEPPVNMEKESVKWTGPDLWPSSVHVLRDGLVDSGHQNPSYNQRTSLFSDQLSHGNISLKLSRVKLSDQGSYRCWVTEMGRGSDVRLNLGKIYCSKHGWKNNKELY